MNRETILDMLQRRVPNLLAIYVFGSRAQGTARPDSDLDLAVLVAGYAEPLALWALTGDLADLAGCPVDLLDLRAASTVMQHQIITTGQRCWAKDAQAALYEAAILSEKPRSIPPVRACWAIFNKGERSMVDDVLINKAATIERCVKQAREEYERDPATFATDFTRQDAAILNIQRACEAALDMG